MNKILEIAAAEIGTKEEPAGSNQTQYGEWFGLNGVSWCGIFVSWCFDHAGFPLGNIGYKKGFAGCQTAVANIVKWGRLVTIPKEGDIVFYDWQGDGKFDHTGIFVKDLGKELFEAIEGNTAFGNDSNGGMVMRRADRKYKHVIFVRPFVTEASI